MEVGVGPNEGCSAKGKKIRVKLFLCLLIKHYTMKAYGKVNV
jgi:hypothetical protein